MVISGVNAPPRIMGACRLTSAAILPRVTAPNRRYVTSAEHKKETRLPTSTALRKRAGSWPIHPDSERLQSAASTCVMSLYVGGGKSEQERVFDTPQ